MKNSTKIIVSILSIIAAIVVILLPFIVEKIYYLEPPCDFFLVGYDATDILSYYGSVLSFVGATILGVLTLRQNKKAQEKSDEVNRLQLELQRKSMAMAEAQYSKEQNHDQPIPKFEISLSGYNGNYANLSLSIKNVASIIVSCLTPISFVASDADGNEISKANQMSFEQRSLSSAQTTGLKTNISELVRREKGGIRYYSNVSLSLSFSCEDEKGNTHYYRAMSTIPSTKEFHKGLWSVEKVG